MYRLFMDLASLLAACAADGAVLHIEDQERHGGSSIPTIETALILTAPVPAPAVHPAGGPTVYAARIVVESALYYDSQNGESRQCLVRRVAAARDLIMQAAAVQGVAVAQPGGIVAVPGLLEDLRTIRSSQALWRWEGVAGDPDLTHHNLVPIKEAAA